MNNSKILVIGNVKYIGSFIISELLKEGLAELVVYDNFARGKKDYMIDFRPFQKHARL